MCYCCNTIRHVIYPAEFMDRITLIFLYQMQWMNGNSLKWRIVRRFPGLPDTEEFSVRDGVRKVEITGAC